jgi:hypothetical protein
MAEPTQKAPALDAFIKDILGIDRQQSIRSDKCAMSECGKDAKEFRNTISRSEYLISGMCQDCQDSFFGKD